MSFWTWLKGDIDPPTPNAAPGDPDGVTFEGEETFSRSLPMAVPSPWAGWPAEWGTPVFNTQTGLQKLIDVAWSCIDLNASVLAAMPVYRLQSGKIVEPLSWMSVSPDPLIYSSWQEFAKQLFWDFQLGEVFVLPMSMGANGYPLTMRVIPPWLVNVELRNGTREYSIGRQDVTNEILHIRYQSSTDDARGHGPLEVAGARMTAAGLLQKSASRLIETGGVPHYWVSVERRLDKKDADELLNQWVESRTRRAGEPALMSGGAELRDLKSMTPKDMTMLELSQFNESRIAVMLGVPPFLAGLPSGGDSMTYSNVSSLFDFHDRASLRPKAMAVMSALSNWALPRGQSVELNRDEYSRPAFKDRTDAYKTMIEIGAMTVDEVREMERLHGEISAAGLSGNQPPQQQLTPTASPAPAPSPTGGQNNVG